MIAGCLLSRAVFNNNRGGSVVGLADNIDTIFTIVANRGCGCITDAKISAGSDVAVTLDANVTAAAGFEKCISLSGCLVNKDIVTVVDGLQMP